MPQEELAEPEAQKQELKTFHFGEIDVVIPMSEMGEEAYKKVLNLVDCLKEEKDSREVAGDHSDVGRHFLVRDGDSEPFFVKERRTSGPNDTTSEVFRNLRRTDKEPLDEAGESNRRRLNALHSVLNEIRIADDIEKALGSSEIQQIAAEAGFDGIETIKPLFAAVDKRDRRKYVAYDYKSDTKTVSELFSEARSMEPGTSGYERHTEIVERIQSAMNKIKTVLQENGISPEDYGMSQFLYDETRNALILIDTEAWYKA